MTERTLNDTISGDDVSLSGGKATFNDRHVDDDKIVTLTGATLTGTNAGNYNLTEVLTTTANITPRKLTLDKFVADNREYDGTTDVIGAGFYDDRVSGNALEFDYDVSFKDENVEKGKEVNFINISISGGIDQYNYNLVTKEGTAYADIVKRILTLDNFVANNKIYDGTTDVTGDGFDDDRLGEDELEFRYDVEFENRHPGEEKKVNFTGIEIIGGKDAGNYSIAIPTGTANANIYNLVTLSREIFGSPYYEVDTLGVGREGFDSNPISNSAIGAKHERGRIEYRIHELEGFTYPIER